MLTCIILNYNDADSVLKLYSKIKNYTIFDYIIIVDNASTDNSYQKLKKLSDEKTKVLLSDKNGGYGYGNNIGLLYSKKIGATNALVANPDVDFEEKTIFNCLEFLRSNSRVVAIAPKIEETKEYSFRIVPAFKDFLSASLLLNKIFKPRLYKKEYFENKILVKVDTLIGSLVLFDLDKFSNCGFYDENVFLYNEELIIGQKFKKKGFISLLNLKDSYQHYHGVSVQKNFVSVIKLKKLGLQSHFYYLKHYANANFIVLILFRLLLPYIYIENILYGKIRKYIWKKK